MYLFMTNTRSNKKSVKIKPYFVRDGAKNVRYQKLLEIRIK